MDVGRAGHLRRAGHRGEDHPAGADAHGRRGLAGRGEAGPPHPLAADRGGPPDADRRRGADLLVHRPGPGLGRPLAADLGPDPGERPAGAARAADPPQLGRVRVAGAGPVGQPAPGPGGRSDPGAARSRDRGRRARVRGPAIRAGRRADDGGHRLGPDRHRGPVRPVHRGVRPGAARAQPPRAGHPEPGQPEPSQPESGLPGPEDALGRQIELVHAWRRFPALDPALPRELLPARWSGLAAARLFGQRHQQWSAAAGQQWRRLNDVG